MVQNERRMKRMDQINVEEFKRNIKTCLDQLPFAVTRRGKVLFVCYGPEGMPETTEKQPCQSMPALPIVPVASPGDTIYEPDPVKPAKAPKVSVSKQAVPIVAALLSSISKQPTVSHHPLCTCAMCKLV